MKILKLFLTFIIYLENHQHLILPCSDMFRCTPPETTDWVKYIFRAAFFPTLFVLYNRCFEVCYSMPDAVSSLALSLCLSQSL